MLEVGNGRAPAQECCLQLGKLGGGISWAHALTRITSSRSCPTARAWIIGVSWWIEVVSRRTECVTQASQRFLMPKQQSDIRNKSSSFNAGSARLARLSKCPAIDSCRSFVQSHSSRARMLVQVGGAVRCTPQCQKLVDSVSVPPVGVTRPPNLLPRAESQSGLAARCGTSMLAVWKSLYLKIGLQHGLPGLPTLFARRRDYLEQRLDRAKVTLALLPRIQVAFPRRWRCNRRRAEVNDRMKSSSSWCRKTPSRHSPSDLVRVKVRCQ